MYIAEYYNKFIKILWIINFYDDKNTVILVSKSVLGYSNESVKVMAWNSFYLH